VSDENLPALRLKFSHDIGPNPSGLAGREFFIPLQAVTKSPAKVERKHSGNVGMRVIDHDGTPSAIEITPEMIEAGSAVFCREESLDLGDGFAELFSRRVLKAALGARGRENSEVG
jgi:hypothetical protein